MKNLIKPSYAINQISNKVTFQYFTKAISYFGTIGLSEENIDLLMNQKLPAYSEAYDYYTTLDLVTLEEFALRAKYMEDLPVPELEVVDFEF